MLNVSLAKRLYVEACSWFLKFKPGRNHDLSFKWWHVHIQYNFDVSWIHSARCFGYCNGTKSLSQVANCESVMRMPEGAKHASSAPSTVFTLYGSSLKFLAGWTEAEDLGRLDVRTQGEPQWMRPDHRECRCGLVASAPALSCGKWNFTENTCVALIHKSESAPWS